MSIGKIKRKRVLLCHGGIVIFGAVLLNSVYTGRLHRQFTQTSFSLTPEERLLYRISTIQSACGELCKVVSPEQKKAHLYNATLGTRIDLLYFPDIKCPSIMALEEIDAADDTFPTVIPPNLLQWFLLNGTIALRSYSSHLKNPYLGTSARMWSKDDITSDIEKIRVGQLEGTYGSSITNAVFSKLSKVGLTNKSLLVIGSESPWIETICLALGASKVTTLEYATITSNHPRLFSLTPSRLREIYSQGSLELFDGVVSFSSVEHSGLGRYGDALNPWGDLLAIARAWCVVKVGGFLVLNVPTGKDAIEFNAHRIYGRIRFPLLTANWAHQDGGATEIDDPRTNFFEPLFSFKKLTDFSV